MNKTRLTWLTATLMACALPLAATSASAQDRPKPDSDKPASDTPAKDASTKDAPTSDDSAAGTAKPKPIIYKAGEKIEAAWSPGSNAYSAATIVSNLGGGKYMIRWESNSRTETKAVADIRRIGETQSSSHSKSSIKTTDAEEDAPKTTPAPTDSAYALGDKITFKSEGKSVTGIVTTIVNENMLKVVIDGQENEKVVFVRNITAVEKAKKSAITTGKDERKSVTALPSEKKTPAVNVNPGVYTRGQKVQYTRVSSPDPGIIVRDMGALVTIVDPTNKYAIYDIKRADIATPPERKPDDTSFPKMDMSAAFDIAANGWKSTPPGVFSPGPATLDSTPKNTRIKLGGAPGSARALFICPALPVGFVASEPATAQQTTLTRFDLNAGAPNATFKFPAADQIIDVSPDGARALTESAGLLTLWSLAAADPVKILTFEPFAPGSSFAPATDRAYLCGSDMVILLGAEGKEAVALTITSDQAKVVWYFYNQHQPVEWAFTPQRTALATCASSGTTAILDAASGRVIGSESKIIFPKKIAFSTNGKLLAVLSHYGIVVINVADKLAVQTLPLQAGVTDESAGNILQWVDSNSILINNNYLVSTTNGVAAWQFTKPIPFTATGSGIAWAIQSDPKTGNTLASTYLIDSNVSAALENASSSSVSLFKSGDSLAIAVNVEGGPPGLADRARQNIEARCKTNNIKIDPASPFKLTVSATQGPPKDVNVRGAIQDNGDQKATYRTVTHKVEITKNGTPIWLNTWNFTGPGMSVTRNPNETYQQALDRMAGKTYESLELAQFPVPIMNSVQKNPPQTSPLFP